MKYGLIALSLVAAVGLAGCASNPCTGPQAYQKVSNGAPLKGVDGLTAPKPDPTFDIPRVASGPRFVSKQKNAQGKDVSVCLATPPAPPATSQHAGASATSLHD